MQSDLRFEDFTDKTLASHLDAGVSCDYLVNYLQDLGAKAIVVEEHYVDRHYLDEFASYYCRSFRPPPHDCVRLHFFASHTSYELEALVAATFGLGDEDRSAAIEPIQRNYLGFLVRRPLPGARIGRTVLRTYPAEGRRHFEVGRKYRVHIAGLRLSINGIAFQHQDGGAAVCASTSLWTALQRVAHLAGERTPTPNSITSAAGSPFPASAGLTGVGLATAVRKLGFIADMFHPGADRAWFRAMLATCLESGLPVVLMLNKPGVGHAIALTGYSQPQQIVHVECDGVQGATIRMLSGSLQTVYAHDDNLGPHAHYELEDGSDPQGKKILLLHRGVLKAPRPSSWKVDTWQVVGALVPKPEKLRLGLANLVQKSVFLRELLNMVLGAFIDTKELHFSSRFDTGISVKESVASAPGLDPKAVVSLLLKTSLPRHVGVLTAWHDNARLCELVVDVTEVDRAPGDLAALAMLATGTKARLPIGHLLGRLATALKIPVVLGA